MRILIASAAISLVAVGACDRNKTTNVGEDPSHVQKSAEAAEEAAQEAAQAVEETARDLNAQGAAGPDASIAEKTTAALDPSDGKATFAVAKGVKLKAEARLNQGDDGVHVHVDVTDGPPGAHGIHVHEKPDCSDIPGKSMGSHFAPEGHAHALPTVAERHLGDLGNIEIDKDGKADFEIVVPKATLIKGDRMSFLDRAIVIHQKRDVGTGDSGDAGKPIACAIVVAD